MTFGEIEVSYFQAISIKPKAKIDQTKQFSFLSPFLRFLLVYCITSIGQWLIMIQSNRLWYLQAFNCCSSLHYNKNQTKMDKNNSCKKIFQDSSEEQLPPALSSQFILFANSKNDVSFNKADPNQKFFRESRSLEVKNEFLTRFGWKVVDLQRQEQDLAMECCTLLQSKLEYPVSFFTNSIEAPTGDEQTFTPVKCLWMVTSIHRFPETNQVISLRKQSQYTKIFDFYQAKLLPNLTNFIKTNLTWQKLSKYSYNDHHALLVSFQQSVIKKANDLIKTQFSNTVK